MDHRFVDINQIVVHLFVDISQIVVHHCVSFLFIKSCKWRYLDTRGLTNEFVIHVVMFLTSGFIIVHVPYFRVCDSSCDLTLSFVTGHEVLPPAFENFHVILLSVLLEFILSCFIPNIDYIYRVLLSTRNMFCCNPAQLSN